MTMTSARLLTPEQVQHYKENGYVVLRGLFGPDEVREIREAFMALADGGPIPGLFEVGNYRSEDPLSRYPRVMHPHRHPEREVGPLSMRYMLDSRVADALRELLGEEAVAAQSMFYYKPPGARGQALHQDNFYLRVHPGTCIAAWTAVDDADEENGGLRVVPGSHRLNIFCPETADMENSFTRDFVPIPEGLSATPIELKAGDVLFFNGSVIHGSTPNSSADRFRRAFICHYVPQSSEEVSRWYRPLLRFDGEEILIDDATGGGPCGNVPEAMSAH